MPTAIQQDVVWLHWHRPSHGAPRPGHSDLRRSGSGPLLQAKLWDLGLVPAQPSLGLGATHPVPWPASQRAAWKLTSQVQVQVQEDPAKGWAPGGGRDGCSENHSTGTPKGTPAAPPGEQLQPVQSRPGLTSRRLPTARHHLPISQKMAIMRATAIMAIRGVPEYARQGGELRAC